MNRFNKNLSVILFLALTFGFTVVTYSQSGDESSAGDLPLPSVLIKKHIEAVGGEETIQSHTAQTTDGKLIIKAMNIEGNLHVVAEAPNKIKTTIGLGQYGKSISGYNGTVGWSMDPMSGNRILEGEALKQMIARADFYGNDLHLGKDAVKLETVQTVEFEDGEQYKVLSVDNDGEESYLYFSKETGLLSGIDRMESGAMGKVPTQIRMSGYIESGGVKTARKISSMQNEVETIIEIDSVSYSSIAENAFELPEEIQSKLKQ